MEFVISKCSLSLTSYGSHAWEFLLAFGSDLHQSSSFSICILLLNLVFFHSTFVLLFEYSCIQIGLFKWTLSGVSYLPRSYHSQTKTCQKQSYFTAQRSRAGLISSSCSSLKGIFKREEKRKPLGTFCRSDLLLSNISFSMENNYCRGISMRQKYTKRSNSD